MVAVQLDGALFHEKVVLFIECTQRIKNQFVFRCVVIVGIEDVKQKRRLTSILLSCLERVRSILCSNLKFKSVNLP